MLAFRSGWTRALAARARGPQVCSSFATGPRQKDGTLYEFRTYYLKPSKMNEFLENFKKNVHLRTAHSELVGYWSVEFGGRMNKVFHIWKYDNFAHRTAVRKALAKDKEWQEQFLIPNLTLMDKQESEITYLVPWCKIEMPGKEGVYELATFQMKPGGPALWGDAFKRAIHTHVNRGYTKLVGVFHTEYGALNRELSEILLQYKMDTFGTLRLNRKEVPEDLQKKKLKRGEMLAYQRKTLCYEIERQKRWLFMSPIHHTEVIELERRNKTKNIPIVVSDSNNSVGGVDRVD